MTMKNEKMEILYTINSKYLSKHINTNVKNKNSDEIRNFYKTKSLSSIKSLFIKYMHQKLESKFTLFLQHRGEETLIDDIPLLSSASNIE